MGDIPILLIYEHELDTILRILDRVSFIGRKAGTDVVTSNRFEEAEDIAWSFLAVAQAENKLRLVMEDSKSRQANEPMIEEKLFHEMKEQMYQWMQKAEVMEARLALEKKNTYWAKTFATVWKRAAKENRTLYLTALTTKQAWKEYALGEGESPDAVEPDVEETRASQE